MRLDDFAYNEHSQFGEDGCIAHLLDRIGIQGGVAVEFGAADGLSCSNTARLWKQPEWTAVLVEADAERFELLEGNALPFGAICRRALVQPTGPNSISRLIAEHDITDVDVMSIDIDGDDFFIFSGLECQPRIVVVEFNPTVPPHLELYPERAGSTFGASVLALKRLGERMGYRFVGATYCNAFFVAQAYGRLFDDYETDPKVLLARGYTYAITDLEGRTMLCGAELPWGAHDPYVAPLVGDTVFPTSDNPQHIRRGFESLWGPALWLPPSWANMGDPHSLARHLLDDILGGGPRLVCIDLSNEPTLEPILEWVGHLARAHGYRLEMHGPVLGLIVE